MIVEQGWQCPLCKRVYNPRQEMCLYCGGNSATKLATDSAKKVQEGISWSNDFASISGTTGYCEVLGFAPDTSSAITTTISTSDAVIDGKQSNSTVSLNTNDLSKLVETALKENKNASALRKTIR